eukprot:Nk52_evm60s2657 gene=Nk52_evmTU60s2657
MSIATGALSIVIGFVIGCMLIWLPQLFFLCILWVFPNLKKQLPWDIKKPLHRKLTKREVHELRSGFRDGTHESAVWLNSILARIYIDAFTHKVCPGLENIIKVEIDDLRKEEIGCFLGPVLLKSSYPGECSPVFSNFTVLEEDDDSNLFVGTDLMVEGPLTFHITGSVLGVEIPFELVFRIAKLNGRLLFRFCTYPESTISFAFYDLPDMQVETNTRVMGQRFKLVDRIAEGAVAFVLKKKFVLPNFKVKYLLHKFSVLREGYLLVRKEQSSLSRYMDQLLGNSIFNISAKGWRPNYFILKDQSLSFYRDHTYPKPHDTIHHEKFLSVKYGTDEDYPFSIILKAEGDKYFHLAANTKEEIDSWYHSLRSIVLQQKERRLKNQRTFGGARSSVGSDVSDLSEIQRRRSSTGSGYTPKLSTSTSSSANYSLGELDQETIRKYLQVVEASIADQRNAVENIRTRCSEAEDSFMRSMIEQEIASSDNVLRCLVERKEALQAKLLKLSSGGRKSMDTSDSSGASVRASQDNDVAYASDASSSGMRSSLKVKRESSTSRSTHRSVSFEA